MTIGKWLSVGGMLTGLLTCGCSTVTKDVPLYLYAVGLDEDEAGVRATFLCCEGTSGGSGEDNGEAVKGHPLECRHTGGKSASEALNRFASGHEELYAGTTVLYVLSEDVSKENVDDFAAYLLGSPYLPLKAGLDVAEKADERLDAYAAAYTDADVTKALEGKYANAAARLAGMTDHAN